MMQQGGDVALSPSSHVIHVPIAWERIRSVTTSWVFHLFLSGVIIAIVFLNPPTVFSGDTDTARNYLNTIVSSLSTILALCISIILVAIQMTASNYTHRVLDFFVRLPYNASLFLFYLVTIMHSFILMAKIQDPVPDPLPGSLRPEMSADLVLVVICFVSLLIYMYAVVQLLKPERIIQLILRDYQRAVVRGRWRDALDNVEQICDIAKRSASVSDSLTGTRCVDAMLDIGSSLPLPVDSRDPLLRVHQSLVDQWVEIVGVAVKEKESGLLYSVLEALRRQGQLYVEGGVWPAAEAVIKAFRHLAFSHLISDGQLYYVERVAHRLYTLASCAAARDRRGRKFALRTWEVIRNIGENVFSSDRAGVTILMEGFLLSSEIVGILKLLETPADQKRGLITYFELWKAFAMVGTTRDAARWAVWWNAEFAGTPRLLQRGRVLAVLVANHIHRSSIADTLCHVWGIRHEELDAQHARIDFSDSRIPLFDGWPLRTDTFHSVSESP